MTKQNTCYVRMARVFITLVVSIVTFTGCATTDENELRGNLVKNFPATKITEIRPSELNGIYEVAMGRNIVYTDTKARYFLFGHLMDMPNQKDLTQERMDKREAVSFDSLPKDQAIVFRKGEGTRKVAVFSDPDCPFCRRIEPEISKLEDVTVYLYLYPLSIHPDSKGKSVSVWCSKDPQSSWRDLMISNKNPEEATGCDNPIDKIAGLAQGLNITGTPTLIRADGRIHRGAMSAVDMDKWLGGVK